MPKATTLAILVLLAAFGCGCIQQPRAYDPLGPAQHAEGGAPTTEPTGRQPQPAFKGAELYSWQDTEDGQWNFAMLWGTNRHKSVDEVLLSRCSVCEPMHSVESLQRSLAQLAPGEQLFWDSRPGIGEPPANVRFGYPERAVVRPLQEHCRSLDIRSWAP